LADGLLLARVDQAELGHNHRYELAVLLQYADLADDLSLAVGLLDVFRLNLFAALRDDQRREPAREVEVAFLIERPEITGSEPAVRRKSFSGFFRKIPVSDKDIWSPGQDLPLGYFN
jgi:hypothetical protein